jgi:gamma-glutamyltranspeptidase/glutathione hydrolase
MGFHSAAAVHVMAEAMRHAFVDRNFSLGDPDFVNNPVEFLLSPVHADAIRAAIGPTATPSQNVAAGTPPHERPETTSYAVVDEAGNAVAVTYTLNGWFGAGVMAPGTGFMLNDEMDDFTVKPGMPNLYGLMQGDTNAIALGKRPLSSMAPTIVARDGHVSLVLGSPGGSRIITIVLETILNVLDHRMTPQQAVDAPRLHHQWMPDTVFAEPFALSPDTEALLRNMGYGITTQTPWGAAELIEVGPPRPDASMPSSGNDAAVSGRVRPGLLYGASDPRRPSGAAIGY